MQEVTRTWLARQHHGGHVSNDLLLFTLWHGSEPFLQTQFPLATEEQQEAHLTAGGLGGGGGATQRRFSNEADVVENKLVHVHTRTQSNNGLDS